MSEIVLQQPGGVPKALPEENRRWAKRRALLGRLAKKGRPRMSIAPAPAAAPVTP
ncbi:hypothetical protein SAMN02787144_102859 [Streptomyces atratus]|uniref:Uncharacterized protein n=1 Tax=Streptomyces atratus TaxID=1893 RepID=A0A1K2F1M8_STRAR|nr:hypothetical protein SAMN02787144_102859 [Streptomyces atratus]